MSVRLETLCAAATASRGRWLVIQSMKMANRYALVLAVLGRQGIPIQRALSRRRPRQDLESISKKAHILSLNPRRRRRKAIATWRFAFNDRTGLVFQRLQRSGHTKTVSSQHRGCAPLAQSAERFHGKEKVVSSILTGGSVVCMALVAANTWRCSSVVEQATHNRCVASSILAIATHLKTGNAFPVVGLGALFTVS